MKDADIKQRKLIDTLGRVKRETKELKLALNKYKNQSIAAQDQNTSEMIEVLDYAKAQREKLEKTRDALFITREQFQENKKELNASENKVNRMKEREIVLENEILRLKKHNQFLNERLSENLDKEKKLAEKALSFKRDFDQNKTEIKELKLQVEQLKELSPLKDFIFSIDQHMSQVKKEIVLAKARGRMLDDVLDYYNLLFKQKKELLERERVAKQRLELLSDKVNHLNDIYEPNES